MIKIKITKIVLFNKFKGKEGSNVKSIHWTLFIITIGLIGLVAYDAPRYLQVIFCLAWLGVVIIDIMKIEFVTEEPPD